MFAALSNVNFSTAFTAYPTPILGTNYCAMARPCNIYQPGYYSQFAILATGDNTTVTVTPSTNANLAGSMWTNSFILNQGDTYQINSRDPYDDVTGTLITSDKPIAVFAGADQADVPDQNTQAANPLVQEQLPVEQWGTNVVAMPFAGRTNIDLYRVLTAESNMVAIISANGTVVTNLAAGSNYEAELQGPVQFQSTKPIQVAQFANGTEFDNVTNTEGIVGEGNPCEILLPSTDHYLESTVVVTLTNDPPYYVNGDFDENFINLIVPQSSTNAIVVDGSLVAATNFVAIGTSGYYGAQITITNVGAHTVINSQPVGVEVYGFGLSDAYGYSSGVTK